MGIPLREILDDGTGSMRQQAASNHLDHDAFTMRELVTPQYRPDEVGLSTSRESWQNWVGQHDERRTELRPSNRQQLVSAVVRMARSRERVRAVGSGHSHSNAPAPESTYIELDPGGPGDAKTSGLNDVLDHEGWLKGDDELSAIAEGLDREHLKRLESGIILRRLNRHVLRAGGYALANMGSFDGQTLAGAVNTSTHGTGIGLASISDSVMSVEIATVPESVSGEPIVKLYRIEPTDGITDRDAFEADTSKHEMELIQDDDVFHSVVVGYGCMGVVYAYTMQVVDNYWLHEEAKLMAWSDLKDKLGTTEQSVREFLTRDGTRHCQILINTAAEQVPDKNRHLRQHSAHGVGKHEDHQDPVCLVKRHKVVDVPRPDSEGRSRKPDDWVNWTKDQRWPPERLRRPWRDLGKALASFHPLAEYPGKAKQLHNHFFHPELNKDPFVGGMHETVWYVALRRLRDRGDENTSEYHHPKPPHPTPTVEMGVPVGDVVEAVDTFRGLVRRIEQGDEIPPSKDKKDRTGEGKDVFFPVPMGVRFTAASAHHLSPEHGRATAMVELPLPLPKKGQTVHVSNPLIGPKELPLDHDEMRELVVIPALTKVERFVLENREHLGPRPHMGKHNTVDAEWLDDNYEYFDASDTDRDTGWYQAYRRFNAFGTFDNKFTEQLGLDEFTPANPDAD